LQQIPGSLTLAPTFIVNKDLNEAMAYELTKIYYENMNEFAAMDTWFDAMVKINGVQSGFLPKDIKHTMLMPYHSGAIQFLKEKRYVDSKA